jgi:hypothetical protein
MSALTIRLAEACEKTGLSQRQFGAGRRRKIEKSFSPNPRKVLCTRVPSKGLEAPVELESNFVTQKVPWMGINRRLT